MAFEYMNAEMLKEAEQIFLEYTEEMKARGAWSGHASEIEYFADLYSKTRNILNGVRDNILEEQKNGKLHFCENLLQQLNYSLSQMHDSYSAMEDQIYRTEWTELQVFHVADLLNQDFREKFFSGIAELENLYQLQTGKDLAMTVYPQDFDNTEWNLIRAFEEEGFSVTRIGAGSKYLIESRKPDGLSFAAVLGGNYEKEHVKFCSLSPQLLENFEVVGEEKYYTSYETLHKAAKDVNNYIQEVLKDTSSLEQDENDLPFT